MFVYKTEAQEHSLDHEVSGGKVGGGGVATVCLRSPLYPMEGKGIKVLSIQLECEK